MVQKYKHSLKPAVRDLELSDVLNNIISTHSNSTQIVADILAKLIQRTGAEFIVEDYGYTVDEE